MRRRSFGFLLCLLLSPLPAFAAIVEDHVSCCGEGTTSATFNATVSSGASIAVACVFERDSGGAVAAPSGVTINGEAMTLVTGASHAQGGVMHASMWYKLSPASGTPEVIATAGAGTDFTVVGVISFTGVAQTDTWNTATTVGSIATNIDLDSLASAVGEVGVMCGSVRENTGETVTASADATAPVSLERYDYPHTTDISGTAFAYTEAGAVTSINMRVDISLSRQFAAVGASMRAAADTSTGPLRRRF